MAKKIIQLVYQLISDSPFDVLLVGRPHKDIFRRECKVWHMQVPPDFTLNQVADMVMEMRETAPFIEDEFHLCGQYFICTTKRTALQLALYGLLPYQYNIFPVYQRWGNTAIAA